MRVCYQWALDPPGDWQDVDSADWGNLAKRPLPGVSPPLGDVGYINSVCVQGVSIEGADKYAVTPFEDGCKVWRWTDDLRDRTEPEFRAEVWTFLPLAPDRRIGGRYNTRQSVVIYAAPVAMTRISSDPVENRELRPYTDFVPPDPSLIRFGVWMPNEVWDTSLEIRRRLGWREWTEEVPQNRIVDGVVRG